jgi:cell wall-associated NlpC family hydrolase
VGGLGGLAVLAMMLQMVFMTPTVIPALGGRSEAECAGDVASVAGLSKTAQADIPPAYLKEYKTAAQKIGIQWEVLAGIGKRETDHGRSKLPGVSSGTNYAGAAGPMQFLISTWGGQAKIKIPSTFTGYASDGDGDGWGDVYNPADAILGAARMLKRNGAPDDLRKAVFAYNHANWYVDQVLEFAKKYTENGQIEVPPDADPACDIPFVVSAPNALVAKILEYALAQRGKAYRWGGTGPDAFDCSGIVYMAYRNAGLTIPRTTFGQYPFGVTIQAGEEEAGDLVFFNSGPATSVQHPGHVGLIVSPGKMIEARCTKCGPIKVTTYRDRGNIVGYTRPMRNADVLEQIKRLGIT